jgi:hypothetical protein
MARIEGEEINVGPDELVVGKKVVAARHDRTSPLALIIVVAFVVTCVYVFWGERLGLRSPDPQSTEAHQQIVR